ncbi:GNAT family N-acetyltransferase [Pelobium manganitolerans]|uniref:GNAT family N-acetyltransferase n=1 Tax=Pelobium manganitolerans TaxID=1842495 RepID=UPI003FA38E5C
MQNIEQIPPELTLKLRQKELYPNLDLEKVKLSEDDNGIHLGLFHENRLITVVSLFITGKSLQFRKLATDSRYQKQGFGTQMIKYIINFAREEQLNKIWCNARESAEGFYSKLGFKATDEKFIKNGIPYLIMEMELD